jgi:2,5-dihydroxypyridine 5,6-dioxygenase
MLVERVEGKWVEAFRRVFSLCAVKPGEVAVILSETQSRRINVWLSELALSALGARIFHVILPTPPQTEIVPVRSTGASHAVQRIDQVVRALAASDIVIDCTVEGMLHAPELPDILKGGTRLMMISNEHPEILERLMPDPALRPKIQAGVDRLAASEEMRVISKAGTDLTVKVAGAPARGAAGFVDEPGKLGYWPAGLCLCFPLPKTVAGQLVLTPGDVNLTFKTYLKTPIRLAISDNHVTEIEGEGLDAALMRSYYSAWNDPEAYAVSHVGWGMNPKARWDAMVMYDRRDHNGTEIRAFAGNFLFSTGANEFAGAFTKCHFDLPMRGCSIYLDGEAVVIDGVVQGDLT